MATRRSLSARVARAVQWLSDGPWPLLLAAMTMSFTVFGLASANLFLMLSANLRFLREHGLLALQSGGALQLAALAFTAYVGVLALALTKWFEHRFMDRLSEWTTRHADRPDGSSAPERTPTHSRPCARPPLPAPPAPTGARRGRGGRR